MVFEIMVKDKIDELNEPDKRFIQGYEYATDFINQIIRANSDIVEKPELPEDSIINTLIREYYNYNIDNILDLLHSHIHDLVNGMLDAYPLEGE